MENEIRIDPRFDYKVIIAADRGKRPEDFHKLVKDVIPASCVFDRGRESETMPDVLKIGDPWVLRVFENKFPEFQSNAILFESKKGPFLINSAYGRNEVVVDTYKHGVNFEELSQEEHLIWLNALIERELQLYQLPRIKHVFVFKNQGEEAGASIAHAHTQIMATYFIPPLLEREIKKYNENKELFNSMILKETILEENSNFIAIAPYSSRFPGESMILSKKRVSSIIDFDENMKSDFISILKNVLVKTTKLLSTNSYNFVFHEIKDMDFVFHVEIYPRVAYWAGVELGTEMYVNTLPPENFAESYRNLK